MTDAKTVSTTTDLSVKLQMDDKHSKQVDQVMYQSIVCMQLFQPAKIFPQQKGWYQNLIPDQLNQEYESVSNEMWELVELPAGSEWDFCNSYWLFSIITVGPSGTA